MSTYKIKMTMPQDKFLEITLYDEHSARVVFEALNLYCIKYALPLPEAVGMEWKTMELLAAGGR